MNVSPFRFVLETVSLIVCAAVVPEKTLLRAMVVFSFEIKVI